MPRLIISAGAHRGEELQLQRGRNTLGRAETNDFTLLEPSVSGSHCEILVSDFSVRIRDLGSTNGTSVNGQPIRECELADGSTLRLGTIEMRFLRDPVEISVPPLPPGEVLPEPTILPDGTVGCLNHPDLSATRKCVQCGHAYCEDCVRILRLAGRKPHYICPACSGACEALAAAAGKAKSKSFASLILDTMRLPWKRPPT